MKPFFTLFLGLLWSAKVYADCAGEGLWIFPSGQTIKQNSMFVLTGYAESQHVILGLKMKEEQTKAVFQVFRAVAATVAVS